ncbi:hypothetical protein [Xenorhabdus innexi]|uniref:Uncharacterized protein n=1 Tax=Xenorhabdus innexi TaxID=290109 RepID=A0A1N6N113_9GAMM|nr:hypothetical protein [Xenorhabdus innexi]PHM31337.1 hypothetical protein Xinn_02883 [Xenorhabdus innexi]SIP74788.1 hypothetical protein XIS1_840057 [Xenorhabdus innexi]
MSKIKNPVVLVNIHDNHPNSLTVAVTDGSNDWADMRKAVVADLDEPLADESMDKLPLHVLFYTAEALKKEQHENQALKEAIANIREYIGTIPFHIDENHHGQHIKHFVEQVLSWCSKAEAVSDDNH